MTTFDKKDLGKNTLEYTAVVTQTVVTDTYKKSLSELNRELALPGFRKGAVPEKMAEEHLGKDKIYRKAIELLIPQVYEEILKKDSLRPVVSPKVEIISAEENKDWSIKITIALKPEVDLKDYKKLVSEFNKEHKKESIWVPGKNPDEKESEAQIEAKKQKNLNEIMMILLKNCAVATSDLIIENELNRRLTQLVDDVQKAGLTMEAYLKSKNETIDSKKAKFKQEIDEMYRLEFIFEQISENEKITVDQADLESLFAKITDENAKNEAHKNSYLYASILRRQKTLDFLLSL